MSGVAYFRCDASPTIGGGHLMRCLSFARMLSWAGWTCTFVTNRGAELLVPSILRGDFKFLQIEHADTSIDRASDADLVVVDHYALDAMYERSLAADGRVIVVLDDLADRMHDCDILLDATPGRSLEAYAGLIFPGTRMLLGAKYALISSPWAEQRANTKDRLAKGPPVTRILVSMGATDPSDATSRVLRALAVTGTHAYVDVVLAGAAANLPRIRRAISDRVTLHVDPPDFPALAAEADMAIGAAGTSSFERFLLGLPAILIPVAENQRFIAQAFADAGAAWVCERLILDDPEALAAVISSLIDDSARRADISRKAAAFTDRRGCARLFVATAGSVEAKPGTHVHLRIAERDDMDWLLALQQQPETRRYARVTEPPTAEQHCAWFERVMEDEDRLLAIVEVAENPVGMIRLDRMATRSIAFEISIAIHNAFHKKGIGLAALVLAQRLVPGAVICATVLPENAASRALFATAGFSQVEENLFQWTAA